MITRRHVSLVLLLTLFCVLGGFVMPRLSVGKDSRDPLVSMVARVKNSIFRIEVDGPRGQQSQGTGFLIAPAGMIVTNYHVVEDAKQIRLIAADGSRHLVPCIYNDSLQRDLALLKIDAQVQSALSSFRYIPTVPEGLSIAVIGNPLGLGWSVTQGNISAIRSKELPNLPGAPLLQFSAPVSPGSSGSPLLDLEGNVLGVVSNASFGEAQNVNFAVPIDAVMELAKKGESKPCRAVGEVPFDRSFATPAYNPDSYKSCPLINGSDCPQEWIEMGYDEAVRAQAWETVYRMSKHLSDRCPDYRYTYLFGANAALKINNITRAEEAIKKFVEACQKPDLMPTGKYYTMSASNCWAGIGRVLLGDQEYYHAAAAFNAALSLDKNDVRAWKGRGEALAELKDFPQAEAAFSMALKLATEAFTRETAEGKEALRAGENPSSVAYLISSAVSDLIDTSSALAEFYVDQHKADNAEELINKISAKIGTFTYMERGEFDQLASIWGRISSEFQDSGRSQDALKTIRAAIKVAEECRRRFGPSGPFCTDSDMTEFRYSLLKALQTSGYRTKALALLKEMKAKKEISEASAQKLQIELENTSSSLESLLDTR